MNSLDEVRAWAEKLQFQNNTDAKLPNYQCSLSMLIEPLRPLTDEVLKIYPGFDPADDMSLISPEVMTYFYVHERSALDEQAKRFSVRRLEREVELLQNCIYEADMYDRVGYMKELRQKKRWAERQLAELEEKK